MSQEDGDDELLDDAVQTSSPPPAQDPQETMAVDIAQLRIDLLQVASVPSDVWHPQYRETMLEQITECLKHAGPEGVNVLADLAVAKNRGISISHCGHKRWALLCWEALLLLISSSSSSSSSNDDDDNNNQTKNSTAILLLLRGLVQQLTLYFQKLQQQRPFKSKAPVFLPGWLTARLLQLGHEKSASDSNNSNNNNHCCFIIDQLHEMAGNMDVAAVVGHFLDTTAKTTNTNTPKYNDWWSLVLRYTLTQLEPPLVLMRNADTAFWIESILPALLLKLKSHPDTAGPLIYGWICYNTEIPLNQQALKSYFVEWRDGLVSRLSLSSHTNHTNNDHYVQALIHWMSIGRPDESLARHLASKFPTMLRTIPAYSDPTVVTSLLDSSSLSNSTAIPAAVHWALALHQQQRADLFQKALGKYKPVQVAAFLAELMFQCKEEPSQLVAMAQDLKALLATWTKATPKKPSMDIVISLYLDSLAIEKPSKRLLADTCFVYDVGSTGLEPNELYCLVLPRILDILPSIPEPAWKALAKVIVYSKRPIDALERLLTKQTNAAIVSAKLIGWIEQELEELSFQYDAAARQSLQCPNAEVSTTIFMLPSSWQSVQHAGRILASLSLSHVGTGTNVNHLDRPQRRALIRVTKKILVDSEPAHALALLQAKGRILQTAAQSALISLGAIAGEISNDDDDDDNQDNAAAAESSRRPLQIQAHAYCVQHVGPALAQRLVAAMAKMRELSNQDVEIYLTASGVLVPSNPSGSSTSHVAAAPKSSKRLSDDEEWEEQMRRELEAKAAASTTTSTTLSAEEKALLKQQEERRQEIRTIVDSEFCFALKAIQSLCGADIEVGNECLVFFQNVVLSTVLLSNRDDCVLLARVKKYRDLAMETLVTLGSCVYEIEEKYARTIATALCVSCCPPRNSIVEPVGVKMLPARCSPVATVVQQICEFQDALSGPSFAMLFPILRACLTGPRTPIDCDMCLALIDRQTSVLAGDVRDETTATMRKDMADIVLELLKHDRYQAFRDPTAFETLVNCYCSDPSADGSPAAITTAELAPLLDDRGALGKKHCRMGAMMALEKIATDHPKLLKVNPLAENRVWVSCFDSDVDLRTAARKAWFAIRGSENDSYDSIEDLPKPSPLYANPLIPLLSNEDVDIAKAASEAFACAMSKHPTSTERSVELLCTTFIDSFPFVAAKPDKSNSPFPSVAAAPAKKKIVVGLPKKKVPPKKSALEVAGIGRPKPASKRTTAIHAAMLKPKQERTLDHEELANQFKSSGAATEATVSESDSHAKVSVRLGVLAAMTAMSKSEAHLDLDENSLKLITSFLMAYGIADSDSGVKNAARDALRDIVASKGGSDEAISFLLPHLEAVLKSGVSDESSLGSLSTTKVPKDVAASDRRKEGAVVALGSVALHLKGPGNDEKVDNTVDMLLAALETPSEEVQLSVADALTKLMKKGKTQERVESIISNLLQRCLSGSSLAVRRGSAYGLAAAVSGSGIASLKKFDVVKSLEQSCLDGDPNSKEGALFAVELLSSRLGLLFEPYVIVLLPSLLKSFSDGSDYVRKAASHTAGLIMSKLSAHGVKLVLPAVLTAFDDGAWRTKQASIQMLGSMSQLAPKQLASALPKVVPQLTEAFSDTHPKVKASAEEALNQITAVVKNPEVAAITDKLLKALTDPADYTIKALEVLIQTEFLHAIDAPSLALIVPILHRGLRDRGASTKRYSGLIAGNICAMINDPKDLVPYLPTLLPDLQTCLLDPIPDVRSTTAKALGSLTRSLGEYILLELRPWLMKGLRASDCTAAERSGAAQGLTEVLIASGSAVVEEAMREEILPLRSHPEPSTREGVLWMLSYLPASMGQGFTSLIDASLPAIISGLSDDSEPVRDVALRAGRVLIRSHGKVHVDRILPSLEEGLIDEDHRIRVASLSLLGDLLAMIGGIQISRTETNTQDDIRRAERAQAQIALSLGTDTRKRVLASLYMARSDSVHVVRQLAIQVWKTIVSITARTLRDVLAVLVSKIISNLASGHLEKTEVAGRCLGDLVSKLGDSVLPQIIPVLRKALDSGDENTKRGVCVGLTEVIKCSTKDQIIRYIEIIVKVVQDALSADDQAVRTMAASSFQSLYAVVGGRAMDEIVPSMMVALESGEQDQAARVRALNGLTGILSVRSRELLPYILPRLIKRPITTNHAQVLAGVMKVCQRSIQFHFSSIIPAILKDLAEMDGVDAEREESIRGAAQSICGNVDTSGINMLISEIVSKCSSDKPQIRRESCVLFGYIATERADRADFYDQIPVMLREMLYRLNDDDVEVVAANNVSLAALSNHVPAEELVNHVEFMKNMLASLVSDARRRKGGVGDGEFLLPGFNIPKGLEPLIPIYQRGIVYGSPTIREASAIGLGEAMDLTASKYLAGPVIVKLTGPLLRVVGDRNPSSVKIAILKTLERVLTKGGPALRAFVPQFQTTFVKALQDPSRQVRLEAIQALSLLMVLSTRVDPLIKELVQGALGKIIEVDDSTAAAAIQTATLEALATVLREGGTKAKAETSIPSALDVGLSLMVSADEGMREGAAKVVAEACALTGADKTVEVIEAQILSTKSTSLESRHGKASAIRWILSSKAGEYVNDDMLKQLKEFLSGLFDAESDLVREAALTASGAVIGRFSDPKKSLKSLEPAFAKVMTTRNETLEISRSVARALCIALEMVEPSERVDFMGLTLMNGCLEIALKSTQRVQFAFNDVLWLALNVSNGDDGLDKYCALAAFDNQRSMKTLHSKVLAKIKELTIF